MTWDQVDPDEIRSRPRVVVNNGPPPPPLILRPATLPDPATIPPRPWLYGTQCLRGFVTVLVAPGGTGKSSYAMAVALAVTTGRKLLFEHVFERTNASIINLEDPMEELERRIAALMIRHKIGRDEVADRLFLNSGEDRRVTMAAIGPDGFSVVHPDEEALVAEIKAHVIGLIVVDPFAESHTLEENSNPQMIQAAAAWRRVARATNCAIILVHHVRKGAVTDIDAARGAKALTDSARVGLLLSAMTTEEAKSFGIPSVETWQYVRLDNAKANMAPKGGKATWFQLDQVLLGNQTEAYVNGDRVAAIVAWSPPNLWASISALDCNRALDCIATGPAAGVRFTLTRRGGSERWAGQILMEMFDFNDDQAKQMLAAWLRNGVIANDEYHHPEWRRPATGVRVIDAKRPT